MGSEMTREFCGVVWGGAPAENGFSLGFIQSPQIASGGSKFFAGVLKSGGKVPPVQKWVTGTPRISCKLRL